MTKRHLAAVPRAALILTLSGLLTGCSKPSISQADGGPKPDATIPIPIADAGPPDAPPCSGTMCGTQCVDTTVDRDHCGTCFASCSAAADCVSSSCSCPANFVPTELALAGPPELVVEAPVISAFGAFVGGDTRTHIAVASSNFEDDPTGVAIDLTTAEETPFVTFAYDFDAAADTTRSGFQANTGSLTLSRTCEQGFAGELSGATLIEVDPETQMPVPGGCTLTVPTTSFDFGEACP